MLGPDEEKVSMIGHMPSREETSRAGCAVLRRALLRTEGAALTSVGIAVRTRPRLVFCMRSKGVLFLAVRLRTPPLAVPPAPTLEDGVLGLCVPGSAVFESAVAKEHCTADGAGGHLMAIVVEQERDVLQEITAHMRAVRGQEMRHGLGTSGAIEHVGVNEIGSFHGS